jgi:hypothetical protein
MVDHAVRPRSGHGRIVASCILAGNVGALRSSVSIEADEA